MLEALTDFYRSDDFNAYTATFAYVMALMHLIPAAVLQLSDDRNERRAKDWLIGFVQAMAGTYFLLQIH